MLTRLAWRSLWRNKRRTLITVVSIAFGLTFAIFFVSMGEGMYGQMIDQVVRLQAGHITLQNPEYSKAPSVDLFIHADAVTVSEISSDPLVDRTKMIILGQGIAKSGADNVAAGLMGVEPAAERASSPLVKNIVAGEYLNDDDDRLVVIGQEMATRLNLDVGKKLVLSSNDVSGDLVEELCRVKGIFHTGSDEIDAYFIQMPIKFARKLFHMPEQAVTQLGLILKNPDDQARVIKTTEKEVDAKDVAVLPWQQVMPEVASYIKLDRASNWIFQGLLIFLILFTIFNTILMSVLERQREFAVLTALGTKPMQLRFQLFMESVFLGLVGCGLGMVLGAIATYWGHFYGIDLTSLLGEGITISGFAMTAKLTTAWSAEIIIKLGAIVYGVTLIISLFPMRRATRVKVVDALR
jgi:ABC-type lipoprotein release transport system permease subunit